MRNTFTVLTALAILGTVLGCGITDRVKKEMGAANTTNSNANANKTITDRAVETAVGSEKIGIVECDEAIDILAAQANNPDDNFIVKAGKATGLSKFREQVKKGLENNKANRADVAKFCRDFKANLDKSASDAEANKE